MMESNGLLGSLQADLLLPFFCCPRAGGRALIVSLSGDSLLSNSMMQSSGVNARLLLIFHEMVHCRQCRMMSMLVLSHVINAAASDKDNDVEQ